MNNSNKLEKKYDLEYYNYTLPKELIAQYHAIPRSYSKLMVLRKTNNSLLIEHRRFYHIKNYMNRGDVMILNKTKVMKIKFLAHKSTGARCEVMLKSKITDYEFECKIKGGKVKVGNRIEFDNSDVSAVVYDKKQDNYYLRFNRPIEQYINKIGLYPNPPYIKRIVGEEYQPIFASVLGSYASPTASLHFTKNLLRSIKKKGVKLAYVTLHVGYDTFSPIKHRDIRKHKMHGEYFEIDHENARIINECKARKFVVGTTTIRALETASNKQGIVSPGKGMTNLFIYPGYKFKVKDVQLITNFHLPKSSLLLLVSAFYGWSYIKKAYQEAIKKGYRFFSLGDAMLLLA